MAGKDRISGASWSPPRASESAGCEFTNPRNKNTQVLKMDEYFKAIQNQVSGCYEIASAARKQGKDPEDMVDVKLARNMAERVEGLISAVAPQLVGTGFTKRIIELENEFGALDWRVALVIADEVAHEKFASFKDKREAMEVGIRAGFAYQTGGIVAAPLEGFIELKIKRRRDGKEYVAPCYAGPIRGAGGTAAAFSLILTDYVRMRMGFEIFDPEETEIARYKTEISDYHERVTNLQYFPSQEEIDFLARKLPVQIDGDPTEQIEVSNYKDIDRIETNRIRGGVCLVFAEGLAQKAPKLWKRLQKWGKDFGIDWSFLDEFISLQKKIKAKAKVENHKEKITPNYTYINDIVAGRPVLSHPLAIGGFRLRYGRSRASGFSCAAINPALMILLKNYIATGTQLKVERPGKAVSITPCDTIMGPIVRLYDGTVLEISTAQEAKMYNTKVEKILYLGDLLVSHGDFSENNHPLVPCGFNEDWWARELEKAIIDLFGSLDAEKVSEHTDIPTNIIASLLKNPATSKISVEHAIQFSETLDVPLHPKFTYFWDIITIEDLKALIIHLSKPNTKIIEESIEQKSKHVKIVLPEEQNVKHTLERLGVPHLFVNKEFIILEGEHARAILYSLGYYKKYDFADLIDRIEKAHSPQSCIEVLNIGGVRLMPKGGTFIGARMGRPEKAKMRKMVGGPQVLFPVGEEGGRLRSFQSALEQGKIKADLPIMYCKACNKETIYPTCEVCQRKTLQRYYCKKCGVILEPICKLHGVASTYSLQDIDVKHYFEAALATLKMNIYPDLIKGVRGTSNKNHQPENLVKGILRAKYDLYVNKDGTVRFDMTELPITHFRPEEIGTSLEKLHELGYTTDIKNQPLVKSDQVVEIKPQDIILPSAPEALDEQADKVLLRVAKFVDELLVYFYGMKPFYNAEKREDLVGHLVVGLAPHISAGMVGRIIGFSNTQGMFAHPLFHAALRRDCDGDEACVILLLDALLNFSRQFLPDSRGAKTMDAPLVLTSKICAAEVDDMAHGLDIVWNYPLALYKAAQEYKNTSEIRVEQIKHVLGTERQYQGMGFTHDVSSINMGVNCSAYKALPSMEDKLLGQMELAEKINAVDEKDVARLVLEKHLLKDTRGNLRKFSTQQFRCVKCNEKFRRPPLTGSCTRCGGRLIFTVSEGSVTKYLEPSISLAKKYSVPAYLTQSIELLKMRVEGVFGKEREVQHGLGKWFG
ncbi:MAG: DNA polymerase II large subunit [Candidatus Woesearchaeota archaeon]